MKPLLKLHWFLWCSGQVELADEEEMLEPRGQFVQGPNIRVGTIPINYDANTKKATWFWFLALSVSEEVPLSA